MAFRFRFETLLRVRKIREDIALQEFSKAQKKCLELRALLKLRNIRKADLHEGLSKKLGTGITAREVGSYDRYLSYLEDEITKIEQLMSKADKQLEKERQALLKTKREFKAMERLKEMDKERFTAEQNRQEMRFIDEIAVRRHGSRQ